MYCFNPETTNIKRITTQEHLQFYIDGEWVDPATPASLDVINPTTEKPFTTISMDSADDVNKAVSAAKTAF
jgi:aldehyde dehydrogenase (NAD+)